jgi:hypothetical protein
VPPTYFVVVAKNWVHAYQAEEEFLVDKSLTRHHCGGLEFFDSDGYRYAPRLGSGLVVEGLERTIDEPSPALVAERIETALSAVEREFQRRPAELLEQIDTAGRHSEDESFAVIDLETFQEEVGLADFHFSMDGEALAAAIKSRSELLGGIPTRDRTGHIEGTSWAHRLCHAVGAC